MEHADNIKWVAHISGLDQPMTDAANWADETFGAATPRSITKDLLKEAKELADNPTDGQEMADILMLLAHLAFVADIDLAHEVRTKLEICKQRTWGQPDADGVVEHVR